MKLTVFLLVVSIFSVQANVYSQKDKVTLDLEGVELKMVLETIESLTDLKFFYNNKKIDAERMVSVRVVDRPVSEVLDRIFQGTSVYYVKRKRQVIFKLRKVEKPYSTDSDDRSSIDDDEEEAQQSVSGTVTDSNGLPLPGANIIEKGTTNGTTADFDGDFSISLNDEEAILVVSYIGFATKEVTVNGQDTIDVTLEEDAAGLDEVVVVGYGTQKRKDVTGAIATVSASEIQSVVASDAIQSIQGRVAGLDVSQSSWNPGAEPVVRIRGNRSFTASNDPLYIIDGIPISRGINEINPADIESMEVLKDASATAIYGSRGANGVIIITTRRGKSGKTSINYDSYGGLQMPLRTLDIMNGGEYAEFVRETYRNRSSNAYMGNEPSIEQDESNVIFTQAPYTLESVLMGYDDQGNYNPENVRSYDWVDAVLRSGKNSNFSFGIVL